MPITGQNTMAVGGTAEPLGAGRVDGPLLVKALPGNSNPMYVGNTGGDVDSTNGYPLSANQEIRYEYVRDLADIMIDGTTGEGVAWAILILN